MAFMINSHRRFRPQTEPMLAHAGHWYLSQAWAKALTWVWNEHHCPGELWTVRVEPAGDNAFPDADGHVRLSTQSQVGPRRGNNGGQGSLRGLGVGVGASAGVSTHSKT